MIERVRIDTWLWVARFFKTRAIAKQAVNNGKVRINNNSCKPSKTININDTIKIKIGWSEKTIVVLAVSEKRSNYEIAKLLYKETEESIEANKIQIESRKLFGSTPRTMKKPDKKQRRTLLKHKRHEI